MELMMEQYKPVIYAVLMIIVLYVALRIRAKIVKSQQETDAAIVAENDAALPLYIPASVKAFFFSPTGTTKKIVSRVAEDIASLWDMPLHIYDFTLPAQRDLDDLQEINALSEIYADDIVIFGVPTYAGRVPNVLLPFFKDVLAGRGNGAFAIPIVLFGNRNYDDSLIELRDLLADAGFMPIAGAAFVGEHSFSNILGAERPDEEDMTEASAFAASVYQRIHELKELPTEKVYVNGEEPYRPYYTPRDRHGESINILKVKPKVDEDKCIDCKLCARVCPMGSIDFEDISNYTGICIKCGACEKECPTGARYYDDPGYLYHKKELEEMYTRRAEPELF
jgi:NAD-dependent dihydropyrimidine dehydrogenase PreA subunit/flavodoxin